MDWLKNIFGESDDLKRLKGWFNLTGIMTSATAGLLLILVFITLSKSARK